MSGQKTYTCGVYKETIENSVAINRPIFDHYLGDR